MTFLRWGAASDVGMVRAVNQDSYLIAEATFAVADGMGGHAAGEVAAQLALASFRDALDGYPSEDRVRSAVSAANTTVYERSINQVELRGMGTTLVALAVSPDREHAVLVNVGDSRAYLFRSGSLKRLSRDHTYVQDLVDAGQLTEQEARNHPQRHIVTRALGIEPGVEIDTYLVELAEHDRYLLCSDGLVGEVSEEVISAVLSDVEDPQQAADLLVGTANAMGGHDNTTVVLVDVGLDEAVTAAPEASTTSEEVSPGSVPDRAPDAVAAVGTLAPQTGAAADASVLPTVVGADDITTLDQPRWDDATTVVSPPGIGPPGASPAGIGPPGAAAVRRKRPRSWRATTAFVLAFVVVIVVAFGAIVYFGRSTYYVGFRNDQVALFRGRPGGVLWLHPTVETLYPVTRSQLTERDQARLAAGKDVGGRSAADTYVHDLLDAATTSTTTSTVATSTTAPASTTAAVSTTVASATVSAATPASGVPAASVSSAGPSSSP